MTILAIDTSNYTLGAALVRDKMVMAEYITYLKRIIPCGMPAVNSLLKDCTDTAGSYKNSGGERTGIVYRCQNRCDAGKTLAWSLKLPVSAVSSLEVLAANGRHFQGLICRYLMPGADRYIRDFMNIRTTITIRSSRSECPFD